MTLDFNLVFIDLRSGKVERNPVAVRDQTWHDQTCTLGYSAAGTWNNINYKNDPSTTTALNVGNQRLGDMFSDRGVQAGIDPGYSQVLEIKFLEEVSLQIALATEF